MDNYKYIQNALIYIAENYKSQPSLREIADYVGISEFHFQKEFTDYVGISPKKFLSYTNLQNAKKILETGVKTDDAIFKLNLSSTSRIHDLFVSIQAMTPAEYKNKGQNLNINYSFNKSRFGDYLIASTSKGICEVMFGDNNKTLQELKGKWSNATLKEYTDEQHKAVREFINNKLVKGEKIKLHLKGTNFQIKVWEALLKIPEGKLYSYSSLGNQINSKAFRAVGSAIADNPIAFIIPCHRVIKATGEFGNYRWGKEKKLSMIVNELNKVNDLESQE